MLEMEVIENQDLKMQMITTMQSTCEGKRMYADLCNRQIALRELVCPLLLWWTKNLVIALNESLADFNTGSL